MADNPEEQPSRWIIVLGAILDRLPYTVGLGTITFIVLALPALFWPDELGRYFNGYTYAIVLVIAYFCVPFVRRYIPRIKPRP